MDVIIAKNGVRLWLGREGQGRNVKKDRDEFFRRADKFGKDITRFQGLQIIEAMFRDGFFAWHPDAEKYKPKPPAQRYGH